jgi:hypothetical protein
MVRIISIRQAVAMHLPSPVRAAVGLVAAAADEAKHLPDRAIELPMLAVSTALQMSLRAQQRYARLAARGDELLNRRGATDDPPAWATFDEPVSIEELRRAALSDLDESGGAVLEGQFGGEPAASEPGAAGVPEPPARKAPARKAAAKKVARKPAPGRASTAGTTSAAATTSAANSKTVSKPRHTPPSRFDEVED